MAVGWWIALGVLVALAWLALPWRLRVKAQPGEVKVRLFTPWPYVALGGPAHRSPSQSKEHPSAPSGNKWQAAEFLLQCICWERLDLELELGLGDAALTAWALGFAWCLMGVVWPRLRGLQPAHTRVVIRPNFKEVALVGHLRFQLRLYLWQMLWALWLTRRSWQPKGGRLASRSQAG